MFPIFDKEQGKFRRTWSKLFDLEVKSQRCIRIMNTWHIHSYW